MDREGDVRYWLDQRDRIVYVNQAWDRFAERNNGGDCLGEKVVGRSLWHYISDVATTVLYHQVLDRVRQSYEVSFALRCDGPERRRFLH